MNAIIPEKSHDIDLEQDQIENTSSKLLKTIVLYTLGLFCETYISMIVQYKLVFIPNL